MSMIEIKVPKKKISGAVNIPLSKSISNRALIMSELSKGNVKAGSISRSDDTLKLQTLLSKINDGSERIFDTGNAGTVFRFLTTYLAIKPGTWILGGNERMNNRPMFPLVNSLAALGAEIRYLRKPGFPPLEITGKLLKGGKVSLDPEISSQFCSALMMIAPYLEGGVEIEMKGSAISFPYIVLTKKMMELAGIIASISESSIHIPQGEYKTCSLPAETDWSSAAFWYSLIALTEDGELFLPGLTKNSMQGDSIAASWYEDLGVYSHFDVRGVHIIKGRKPKQDIQVDFRHHPDLALPYIVATAALGLNGDFTGLSTLRYKESDRLQSLGIELAKAGINCNMGDETLSFEHQQMNILHPVETYADHRIAMAFAPLAVLGQSVLITNPDVVNKSYPAYWNELLKVLSVEC